jgi:hypothetical protein
MQGADADLDPRKLVVNASGAHQAVFVRPIDVQEDQPGQYRLACAYRWAALPAAMTSIPG